MTEHTWPHYELVLQNLSALDKVRFDLTMFKIFNNHEIDLYEQSHDLPEGVWGRFATIVAPADKRDEFEADFANYPRNQHIEGDNIGNKEYDLLAKWMEIDS